MVKTVESNESDTGELDYEMIYFSACRFPVKRKNTVFSNGRGFEATNGKLKPIPTKLCSVMNGKSVSVFTNIAVCVHNKNSGQEWPSCQLIKLASKIHSIDTLSIDGKNEMVAVCDTGVYWVNGSKLLRKDFVF